MVEKNWPNFNKNLITKVCKILETGIINYTDGPYGVKFEKEFSKFIGNKYSIAISNGTAALEVAIKSLTLPKNSEILVTARSFFSSASCIVNTGHKPIFVDVNLSTQNISLDDVQRKISKKTRAIICVHLGGLPCDMYNLKKLVKKKNIKIIEDCSQAHGASINNRQVGSFGDISTWSFCKDKIISTLGEGGMISTNKKRLYEFCKKYINHGTSLEKNKKTERFIYNKSSFGTNLRLTEIQSFAGLDQLKNLKQVQKKRENISKMYTEVISKYQNYLNCYIPQKKIKSAWYRLYFFLKTDIKNYKELRFKIIKNLRKNNLQCFTGSCPEIYLEKAFKKFNNLKSTRLRNCKLLGETSVALDINHTLNYSQHKKKILILKEVFEKIFKTQNN